MSQLNVRVEELSPVVRRVQVEVPSDRVSSAADAVYLRLGRTVKLKGYRQGHVPRRVLEKYFADEVKQQATRDLVDLTFSEALDEVKLMPVAAPAIEPGEFKLGAGFSYSARVEVRPEVKLVQWKELDVTAPEFQVTDKQVDSTIESMRQSMAKLVPVEGRDVAQAGDTASISYVMQIGDDTPRTIDDSSIVVQPGKFVDGHGEQLTGLKVGESKSFEEAFGDEGPADVKGKPAKVTVTLKGLKTKELPAVDDEFAKDVGAGVTTVDELKARLREDLGQRAKNRTEEERDNAVLKKLVELNPVEAPPALVDATAERLAKSFIQGLFNQGLGSLPNLDGIVQRLKNDSMERASFQVKSFFLLDAVATAEKLEVTADELNAQIERRAAEEGVPVEKVKSRYRTASALADLGSAIRNEKALKFVVGAAKVTGEPQEATAE